jgi:hypothetical protein
VNHFNNQPSMVVQSSAGTTFQCVDARGDEAMMGTPGGDFAEFLMGLMAWENER